MRSRPVLPKPGDWRTAKAEEYPCSRARATLGGQSPGCRNRPARALSVPSTASVGVSCDAGRLTTRAKLANRTNGPRAATHGKIHAVAHRGLGLNQRHMGFQPTALPLSYPDPHQTRHANAVRICAAWPPSQSKCAADLPARRLKWGLLFFFASGRLCILVFF